MDDFLFSTDSLMFFQHITDNGYSYRYYFVNKNSKKFNKFIANSDNERFKALQERINYLIMHNTSGSSLQDAINFEKQIMYRPYKQKLIKVADTIYYFNYQNSLIDLYTKNCNYIRSISINYHLNLAWNNVILFDESDNKVYTLINKSIFEINLLTGKIFLKKRIDFAKKILINNGYAYVMKGKYYMDDVRIFIHKIKLY